MAERSDIRPKRIDEPRRVARAAGLLYLLVIVAPVSMLLRRGMIVPGDVAATAGNLLAGATAFRLSVLVDLAGIVCYLAVTGLLYFLLRVAGRALAVTAMLFSLAGCIVSLVGLVTLIGPLAAVTAGSHDQAMPVEIALLPLQWRSFFFQAAMTMFGIYCVLTGMLILRSTFMPRVIGALMILSGGCYLVYCSIALVVPPLGARLFPTVLLPGILGEGALALWLVLRGIDAGRWHSQAAELASRPPAG